METKNRALLLSGAMLFMAIDSVRATNGAEKICDIKTANKVVPCIVTTTEIFEWRNRNKFVWEFPELENTREIYGEYVALKHLISVHQNLCNSQLPSGAKGAIKQLRGEIFLAHSHEQAYRDLNRALKDLDKLYRLSFFSNDQYLKRRLKIQIEMREIENRSMSLGTKSRIAELKFKLRSDIEAQVSQTKKTNSQLHLDANSQNLWIGAKIKRKIKAWLKYVKPALIPWHK